jgi:hypothetical protein
MPIFLDVIHLGNRKTSRAHATIEAALRERPLNLDSVIDHNDFALGVGNILLKHAHDGLFDKTLVVERIDQYADKARQISAPRYSSIALKGQSGVARPYTLTYHAQDIRFLNCPPLAWLRGVYFLLEENQSIGGRSEKYHPTAQARDAHIGNAIIITKKEKSLIEPAKDDAQANI